MEYRHLDCLSRTGCRVMQQLCQHGRLHRADLARLNNVTRAAMTKVIQSMIDADLIWEHEATLEPGKKGRPRQWVNALEPTGRGMFSLGISIEKTILMVVMDANRHVLASQRLENILQYQHLGQDAPLNYLADELENLARPYASKQWMCAGIGLSYSGCYDENTNRFITVNWTQSPDQVHELVSLLDQRFQIPVWVEHDTNSELLAESRMIEPRNPLANLMSLNFYLGIAYMFDGRLVRGTPNWGRGLGAFVLHPQRVTNLDQQKQYTLSPLVGPRALVDRLAGYDYYTRPRVSPSQALREEEAMIRRYESGDPEVRELFACGLENLGFALRNLWLCLPVQHLILVGWPASIAEDARPIIDEIIGQWPRIAGGYPANREKPQVMIGSPWQGDHQGIGAAMSAMERSLEAQAGNQEIATRRHRIRQQEMSLA